MANALKILIVGLGHLAKYFTDLNKGSVIHGTYRDLKRVQNYKVDKKIHFQTDQFEPSDFKDNYDYVIWNIPPREHYIEAMKELNDVINKSAKWIFISSTSVYKTSGHLNESSERNGRRELIEIENFLFSLSKEGDRETAVLRSSGLVDERRHPATMLAKKEEVQNSQLKVNIIHTEDAARFLWFYIENKLEDLQINLVCDNHSSKKDYYSKYMKKNGIKEPKWLVGDQSSKLISNETLKRTGFVFKYPQA